MPDFEKTIDEANEKGTTLKELADREGIPVKEVYEFQRRRKYKRMKNRYAFSLKNGTVVV